MCARLGLSQVEALAGVVRQDDRRVWVDEKAQPFTKVFGRFNKSVRTHQGAGTELKKLLARFGIVASPGCSCNAMAARMDALGPDGSQAIIPEVLAVMRREAERRGLPFIEAAALLLVKKAIRNARKS